MEKVYEITVAVSCVEGFQVFACKADSPGEAEAKFDAGECTIVEEDLEVVGLEKEITSIEEVEEIKSRLLVDLLNELTTGE